jgi:hypothetical protein
MWCTRISDHKKLCSGHKAVHNALIDEHTLGITRQLPLTPSDRPVLAHGGRKGFAESGVAHSENVAG